MRVFAVGFDSEVCPSERPGAAAAVVKSCHHLQPNAQGKLNFSFVPDIDYATVRAIEITPE